MISSVLRRLGLRSPPAVRVAVDLTRLISGGQNGGIKLVAYRFLQWIAKERGDDFIFIYFTKSSLVPEVEAFRREIDWQVCVGESEGFPMPESGSQGLVSAPEPSDWMHRWPADVLYAPLGTSSLCRPSLPWVALLVDTLHRDRPDQLPPEEVQFRDRSFRDALAQADAIQCISGFVKRQLELHFEAPAGKLFVTRVAVQDRLVAITPVPGAESFTEMPYFLYPANDWPHKNHQRLIEAYAEYRRLAGSAAWDLVLSGHFARETMWREIIAELGLEKSCRLLGHVKPEEFSAVFRKAGALVFPSLYEGFGIPVLEAMALGVPALCSRVASLPEVAGDAALYFDPEDTGAIALALRRISEDAGLRRQLAAAGLRRASGFSIGREAVLLADRFTALASGPRNIDACKDAPKA